jgi:hypothetical protein
MTSDARESTVKRARDAGANMVIVKPLSPNSLYDRLAWIALTPRKFADNSGKSTRPVTETWDDAENQTKGGWIPG